MYISEHYQQFRLVNSSDSIRDWAHGGSSLFIRNLDVPRPERKATCSRPLDEEWWNFDPPPFLIDNDKPWIHKSLLFKSPRGENSTPADVARRSYSCPKQMGLLVQLHECTSPHTKTTAAIGPQTSSPLMCCRWLWFRRCISINSDLPPKVAVYSFYQQLDLPLCRM